MKIHARVINGKIRFSNDNVEAMFMQKYRNKDLIITIDDEASTQKRRYFEGALIPAVFYQHPHAGWENFKECREAMKLEFIPGWTKTTKGERIKYARSTSDLSNEKFGKMLEVITRWLEENQMEVPDPEEYKKWRDSAPPANEVYPQVARLKAKWEEARGI